MSMINKCTILNWIFSGFLLLIEERVFDKKRVSDPGKKISATNHLPLIE